MKPNIQEPLSKFGTLSQTVSTIVITIIGIVVALWAFSDQARDRSLAQEERRAKVEAQAKMDQNQELIEMMKAVFVTKNDMVAYVEKQDEWNEENRRLMVELSTATDSTLVLILPVVVEGYRQVNNRLDALEELLITADSVVSEQEKVWRYLRERERNDSTAQRHREVMMYLKRINSDKMQAKFGDRAE